MHMLVEPAIAAGREFTVTVVERVHPVPGAVAVISVNPTPVPTTIPVAAPTVAIPAFALLHTTPGVVLLNVVERPRQIAATPVFAAGNALTVRFVIVLHPVGNMYVMFTVPGEIPATSPVVRFTVASPIFPLSHEPPAIS
jgi:hypothetical protein